LSGHARELDFLAELQREIPVSHIISGILF
jgi:hypothetical protein